MVTNSFGNRNFMQPMRRLGMHSKCLEFVTSSLLVHFVSPLLGVIAHIENIKKHPLLQVCC